MGLVFETITALALQGRLAYNDGNYEDCYRLYKQSLGLCRQVSIGIGGEEDRKTYQSSRIVGFLAREIKRLGEKLGQKKKTGR